MRRQLCHCLAVAGQHRLERLDIGELRLGLDQGRHAIEAIDHLAVHWMLDPQCPVLVEGRDALLGRHEVRARLIGRRFHEVDDRLLCGALIPRGRVSVAEGASATAMTGNKGEDRTANVPHSAIKIRRVIPEEMRF